MRDTSFYTQVVTRFTTTRKLATPDTDASSFCQVEIKRRPTNQTLDRVMTAPRFGRGAKARSSDHFRDVRKQNVE